MAKFEDRLWSELIDEHGAQLVTSDQKPPARKPRARAKLVSALAVLAVVIGAVVLALTGHGGPPAYAVTENKDGSITLTIKEALGVAPANTRLAEIGVRVTVIKIEHGCTATGKVVHTKPSLIAEILLNEKVTPRPNGKQWVINIKAIPPGDTLGLWSELVKGATYKGKPISEVAAGAALYRGPAPVCARSIEVLHR